MQTVIVILGIISGLCVLVAFITLVGAGMTVEQQRGHMDIDTYRRSGTAIKAGVIGLVLGGIAFILHLITR
jgi:hypothetical protein